jgi:ABC-2 type transport system permease protein
MVRKELRQLFRDPRTKRVIFVSPVLQLVLFGYAVNTDVRRVATWVVDHDRTAESRRLLDAFTASDYFRVVGSGDDARELERALDRGTAKVGLRISAGFARDLRAGRSPAVQALFDGSNSNTATIAQGYAARIAQQLGERWSPAGAPTGGVDLRTRAWFNPGLVSRVYNVPAVVGVISLL